MTEANIVEAVIAEMTRVQDEVLPEYLALGAVGQLELIAVLRELQGFHT